LEAIAPVSIGGSPTPVRSPMSERTCQVARAPAPRGLPAGVARPIAGRSRWTRPSGVTSVPSFSG
jgi:hypothetical protein